jgi:hypothetical protein
MNLQIPSEIQKGQPILASWLNQLVRNLCAQQLQSSPDHIIRTSSGGTTIENVREPGAARIRYGSIVTDFTSGDSVTVKPCTIDGIVDTAAESFTVYLMPDQSSVDLTSVTIAGASATASACELPEDSVIAYQYGSDGNYIVGEPVYFISDLRYDTTSHKIQAKVQWLVGTVASVESDWIDVLTVTPSYGLVGEDFVSGDVVTVTPCTAEGEAIPDAGEVDVYLRWDGASVDLSKDAEGNVIDAKLPEGTVVSYFVGSNGYANAITEPSCVVTNVVYSSEGIRSYHRWLLAGTQTTVGTQPVTRILFYDVTAHQVQWDNTNKKLQYRTVTFTSPIPATEGAWTDLIEGECLTADIINSLSGGVGGGSY